MGNCWANLCRVNQKQNLPKQEPKQKPQKLVVIKRPAEKEFESRYELGRELKRAEFGTTYFCKDRNTGEKFACKSIPKNKLITSILIEDVRREVAILSHLRKHPNIISLKDIYEDEDHVHLIMELCRGGDLLPNIGARGHYGERAAASVIKTVVQVVQMCHEHGVMLRNLKPENIFFANNMESAPIKVTDFHFSIFFEPGERFNEIVGSPHHMAPEMLKRNYGPEIDIWSAGIILYVLLCGPVPRNWAETEEGYAQTFMQWVLDFKREPWRKVSDNAKDLVKKMLDSDPKCRLTAQEVLDHPWLKNPTTTLDVSFEETVSYEYEAWTLTRVSDTRWTLQHR